MRIIDQYNMHVTHAYVYPICCEHSTSWQEYISKTMTRVKILTLQNDAHDYEINNIANKLPIYQSCETCSSLRSSLRTFKQKDTLCMSKKYVMYTVVGVCLAKSSAMNEYLTCSRLMLYADPKFLNIYQLNNWERCNATTFLHKKLTCVI